MTGQFRGPLTAACLGGVAILVGALADRAPSVSALYGLSPVGPLVDVGLPAARVLAIGAAAVGTGHLLTAAGAAPEDTEGSVSATGYGGLLAARRWWAAQALAAAVVAVLTVAENAGLPPARLLADPGALVVGLEQLQPASGWLVSAGLGLAVAVGAGLTLSWRGSVGLLLAGLAVLLPAALTQSTDADRSHDIVGDAVALHAVAAVLWAGSALAAARPGAPPAIRRGHPVVAAWGLPVVAGSGLVSAAYAVGPAHVLDSGYGLLVLGSAAALLGLLVPVGSRLRRWGAVAGPRVLAPELALLVLGSALGTGLTRLLPPAEVGYVASRFVYLIGYDLPVPLTPSALVTHWRVDLVFGPAAVLAATLYLSGVRRLRRRGEAWPLPRTACWLAGCAVLLVATSSGLAAYAPAVFSLHMTQHMLLATAVPVLLVLGHGATLAVEAAGPGARRALLSLLDAGPVRWTRGPLVAWLAVAATLFGLYPTGLFAAILQQHWAHLAMDSAFLGTGLAVFWAVLGRTPGAAGRGLPALGAIVTVFALMALHAGFSIWLLTRPDVVAGAFYGSLRPALRPDLLADQHVGAVVGWALAEVPVIAAVSALVRRWAAEDRHVEVGTKRDAVDARRSGTAHDDRSATVGRQPVGLGRAPGRGPVGPGQGGR